MTETGMTETRSPDSAAPAARTHAFEADVARLLHLMVHSVYSDRDVFLRELIANAADACERLRYEAIARPELLGEDPTFRIRVVCDADNARLTIEDNGAGMSEGDLVEALGTIARSGTRSFVERMGEAGAAQAESLIGQFGIGFYSAFMVADRVTVETRRAGEDAAWRWESEGKGAYEITPLALDEAPARGARVILHLNEASKGYAEPHRVEDIVREHSGGVAVPVDLVETPDPKDDVVEAGEARVYVDPKATLFLLGAVMDFKATKLASTFTFENPHQIDACGCGESVSLKAADPQKLAH